MEFLVAVSENSKHLAGAREIIGKLWSLNVMAHASGDLVMLPLKRSTLDSFIQNMIKSTSTFGTNILLYLDDGFKPYTLFEFEEF